MGSIITEVKKKLYLLRSFSDFWVHSLFLEKKFRDSILARVKYFSKLIQSSLYL